MLSLIIAESALETVPRAIARHPAVTKHASKKAKTPEEILLDRSYHHAAISKLKDGSKRGRPDLVHFALLEATSTPLYYRNMIRVYLHTVAEKVVFLEENVRLPKSYHRFEGLIEDLFAKRRIRSQSKLLMELRDMRFPELIRRLSPAKVIGLSRTGANSTAEEVARIVSDGAGDSHNRGTVIVVGGFPHGHFSRAVSREIDYTYSISDLGLEAHVVIARVLYECEKILFREEKEPPPF